MVWPARLRALWNQHALPDRHVNWSSALTRHTARLLDERNVDIVLSTSPPHSSQLALARLRRQRRFRWVTDFRDPWTVPARRPRSRLAMRLQRGMEVAVLKGCDLVVTNTPGNAAALRGEFAFLPPGKIEVVPNAFDDAMLTAGTTPVTDSADLTYVGELYLGMVDRMVDALERLARRTPNAVPRIAVQGEVDPREWAKFERAGLSAYVEARGSVAHDESLRVMCRARALLLLLPDAPNWTSCVPSKLYPYLASGRPVLAIAPDGDAARIIKQTGVGAALTVPDAEATADGMAAFLARAGAAESWTGRQSGEIAHYAASAQAGRMDAILRAMLERAT
jgi:hypothetical protein